MSIYATFHKRSAYKEIKNKMKFELTPYWICIMGTTSAVVYAGHIRTYVRKSVFHSICLLVGSKARWFTWTFEICINAIFSDQTISPLAVSPVSFAGRSTLASSTSPWNIASYMAQYRLRSVQCHFVVIFSTLCQWWHLHWLCLPATRVSLQTSIKYL